MASYPAFVQLVRLLGRTAALATLGVETEPDPAALDADQIERLQSLLEAEIEQVAQQLVAEAAASDDVSNRSQAEQFVAERVAGFEGLITGDQAQRLRELAAATTADWG